MLVRRETGKGALVCNQAIKLCFFLLQPRFQILRQYIYIIFFPNRFGKTTIPNDVSMSGNTVGEKKAAAEKSSNDAVTFDTVHEMQNGYSSRNLTKRACFDVNWYRQ